MKFLTTTPFLFYIPGPAGIEATPKLSGHAQRGLLVNKYSAERAKLSDPK